MKELLDNDRGFLIDYDYTHRDPFGNGRRYWANNTVGIYYLQALYDGRLIPDIKKARLYVEGRTWATAVSKLDDVVNEMSKRNEQTE
jgi:hypothetical protein